MQYKLPYCDNKLVVAVSGFARSGKSTLCSLLKEEAVSLGKKAEIFSFAKSLKRDLNEFCLSKIGISAFSEDSTEKEKIRPLLIWYGNLQRERSMGRYWVEKLEKEINMFFISGGQVALISDLRFNQFKNDELSFVRSYKNNMVIGVRKFLDNQDNPSVEFEVSAAHESEQKNIPTIMRDADFVLKWRASNCTELIKSSCSDCLELFKGKLIL